MPGDALLVLRSAGANPSLLAPTDLDCRKLERLFANWLVGLDGNTLSLALLALLVLGPADLVLCDTLPLADVDARGPASGATIVR